MDINSKMLDPSIKKIGERHGLTENMVKIIVSVQFEFVKDKMKEVDSYNDHWPYIRLPNLCIFKVKEGKKKYFRKKSQKIIENVHSDTGQ